MGSSPFADTIHAIHPPLAVGPDAPWSAAYRDAGWWWPNPPAPVGHSAPGFLPLDDHHDIDNETECTRRRRRAAGARARAAALRLP